MRVAEGEFPDDNLRWSECIYFNKQVTLNSSGVIDVRCYNEEGYQVYRNVHMIILRDKTTTYKTKSTYSKKKPISVLFIVIDSISRLNFIRTMPNTRDYLLQNNFIEMQGYNKIDDNTYPNFMALLNGMNAHQYKTVNCTGHHVNELDNCPMIWYKFRELGYVTAYGEDWSSLSTFNYFKKGFTKSPTDYYLRPYVISSEKLGTIPIYNAPYCAGPETSGERQLNIALDFAQTFKGSPYFGIFWMNTFSHQALNAPMMFDDKLRTFFANLKEGGILNDSIVILLSDHGMRIDLPIRTTLPGWFEERLPMNLISIPKWFQEEYPTEYRNLLVNSKKLSSTYDLYMTLQHILKLSSSSYEISPSEGCPKCSSLLGEIPLRTCNNAGIPDIWCSCIGYFTPVNITNSIVRRGVDFVLNHIKSELVAMNITQLCHNVELHKVISAGISESAGKLEPAGIIDEKFLFVNFLTEPFGNYIVTMKYKISKNNIAFKILFGISRMDRIPSVCYKLSKYCNCLF
ncbi:hypothetical protein WA026_014825 [Henosepilachna vigintioctopunctata]